MDTTRAKKFFEDRIRVFTTGIVLILASWGVKHFIVSVMAWHLGGIMEEAEVSAERRAEIASGTVDNDIAIARERQKGNSDPKRIRKLEQENSKFSREVRKESVEDELEADADSKGSQAGLLSTVRWFLAIKVLLDLFKITGVFFVAWGTLGFVNDESVSAPLRWFGVAASTVILLSVLVGGILSFLS